MDYLSHLAKDKKLQKALASHERFDLTPRENICLRLCASIMGQQLSTKVAKVLYHRFLELFDGEEPTPQQIAALPHEKLRAMGLSNSKAQYLLNVAQFAVEQGLDDHRLKKMSDEEVIQLLTQIKGVGRWTVEMLLMFTLARPDVFAVDDYGIQVAMKKIYKLEDLSKKELREAMTRIAAKWSPYRTYACLHLWHYKDGD